MSDAKGNSEPSMEEILASIRRIIAEDSDQPAETVAPSAPAPEDDVLELTDIVEDPPISFAMPEPEPEPLAEFRPPPCVPPPPPPEPVRFESPPRDWSEAADDSDRLISEAAAASSSAAFAKLSSRVHRRLPIDTMLGNGNITLEELVREMLRPLLKDWLDAHLPRLVERVVREEVERLARDV
jgi:cell pole-organizing protein PopZ